MNEKITKRTPGLVSKYSVIYTRRWDTYWKRWSTNALDKEAVREKVK